MEERLFWIGVAMGGYAWLSRRWTKTHAINTALKSGLWHGLFCAIAAFSVTLVLVMSLESRTRFISVAANAFSTSEIYPSLALALVAGIAGFWRAHRVGTQVSKRRYFLAEDWEWAETVFSAVLLAAMLMYFILQAFKIPSGSMRNTFLEGDHLFVNKFLYGIRIPLTGKRVLAMRKVERGDIIVFRFPSDNPRELHCGSVQYGKDFIKRVIGLPGDTLSVKGGRVILNGKPLMNEPYSQYLDAFRVPESIRRKDLSQVRYQELWQTHSLDRELQDVLRDHFGPVRVPEGSYLVMGDNRDRSCDSRYWGPVEAKYLKGKAWFIYWPPSRMGGVR